MAVSAEPRHWSVDIDTPGRSAVDWLEEASSLSHGRIKDAMTKGAVWLSQAGVAPKRLRRGRKVLQPGDQLDFYFNEQVLSQQPPVAKLIVDEGGYSVWDKPAGMFSQGSKWGDHCTIYRWAEQHLEPRRPASLAHRLDRAASGLMILTHDKRSARMFAQLFRERRIDKRYHVCVEGEFPDSPWPVKIDTPLDEKPAISWLRRLQYDADSHRSLLEVRIETGRKHQIRRHLAGFGFPVIGDRLYGDATSQADLQLRAVSLTFNDTRIEIESEFFPPPPTGGQPVAHGPP